jgi:hypothetical protein
VETSGTRQRFQTIATPFGKHGRARTFTPLFSAQKGRPAKVTRSVKVTGPCQLKPPVTVTSSRHHEGPAAPRAARQQFMRRSKAAPFGAPLSGAMPRLAALQAEQLGLAILLHRYPIAQMIEHEARFAILAGGTEAASGFADAAVAVIAEEAEEAAHAFC